jgi:mono/diheme cytochrome c family protein
MARDDKLGNIDYTSFTCAACHIGRVRTPSGELKLIEGGVNAEFNIVQYRVKVYETLKKVFKDETDTTVKNTLLVAAFMDALQDIERKDSQYFYGNYKSELVDFSNGYEQQQIALFKQDAAHTITKFTTSAENEYLSYAALLNKNYDGFQKQSLQGFAGMADATGISTTSAYSGLQSSFFGRLFSSYILPPAPGLTDFMSVWEQDKRKASWDKDHKSLINGGGQWNGNIPIPMYRNLAAQLTLGLEGNDIRVAAFGVELLDGLPATVYPFDVDVKLAQQGQQLFTDNCAQCHQPHNGKIYDTLGTNIDRSLVVNWIIRKGGIEGFYKQCSPDTEVNMYGEIQKPCAEFDGVSLKGKKDLIMSPDNQHHGYSARPLSGIWAQAPFLHNGSVPTLYHLLMPKERPTRFIKSQLDYDPELLGFAWDKQKPFTEGYLFDTTSFSTFSNAGHDKDIKEGNQVFKLDWSQDKLGAMAIIEYLKTL